MINTELSKKSVARRLAVYLPDVIYTKLEAWADREGRPLSNLAAFLLETAIRQKEQQPQEGQVNTGDES